MRLHPALLLRRDFRHPGSPCERPTMSAPMPSTSGRRRPSFGIRRRSLDGNRPLFLVYSANSSGEIDSANEPFELTTRDHEGPQPSVPLHQAEKAVSVIPVHGAMTKGDAICTLPICISTASQSPHRLFHGDPLPYQFTDSTRGPFGGILPRLTFPTTPPQRAVTTSTIMPS